MLRTLMVTGLASLTAGCVEPLDVPAYGVYQVYGLVAEADGVLLGPSGPLESRVAFVRTAFAGPRSVPDYLDGVAPPLCLGSILDPNKPPGGNSLEAGVLEFRGLGTTMVVDFADPQSVVPVNGTTSCSPREDVFREAGETGIRYVCEMPNVALVPRGTSVLNQQAVVSTAGGVDIGAFTSRPVETPPTLTASGAFNLFAIDPSAIVAEWVPVAAPLALIEVIAQLADGSIGAQILCLEPMSSGRKVIPPAALELIPAVQSPANPLLIITTLAAVNVDSSPDEGWGGYLVGVGRGSVGMSCRIPGGPC